MHSSGGTDSALASACSLHPGSTILMFHRLTLHDQTATIIAVGHHKLPVGMHEASNAGSRGAALHCCNATASS